MIPMLLSVLIGVFAPEAGITGLKVAPASDRTEVVIHVDGNVSVKDFALANPHRVVLDISGAKQGLALQFSDIQRGGVSGLRVGQYQRDIVRVVIDVTQRVNYRVEQTADGISTLSTSLSCPRSTNVLFFSADMSRACTNVTAAEMQMMVPSQKGK